MPGDWGSVSNMEHYHVTCRRGWHGALIQVTMSCPPGWLRICQCNMVCRKMILQMSRHLSTPGLGLWRGYYPCDDVLLPLLWPGPRLLMSLRNAVEGSSIALYERTVIEYWGNVLHIVAQWYRVDNKSEHAEWGHEIVKDCKRVNVYSFAADSKP